MSKFRHSDSQLFDCSNWNPVDIQIRFPISVSRPLLHRSLFYTYLGQSLPPASHFPVR